MTKVYSYSQFSSLLEGGAAIKSSRPIREDEFPETLESIREILLPILGTEDESDYLIIGSIGKKENPGDVSGDLDLGFKWEVTAKKYNLSNKKEVLAFLYNDLKTNLSDKLGFEPEMNLLVGLNVLSIGWPIKGNPSLGIVQLDLIPLSDLSWAKFAYYSPDYRKGESKYKSAHRNWLFQSILSSMGNVLSTNEEGEPMDVESYVFDFSDGLYKIQKTYRGKRKERLKRPVKVEGSVRELITKDPQEFLDFALGPGFSLDEVKTFESLLNAIKSSRFKGEENRNKIKEKFKEYIERTPLSLPSEIETLE